jgi:hypothetical protein
VPKEIILPVVIIEKSNVNNFMKTPEERTAPDWNKYAVGQKS